MTKLVAEKGKVNGRTAFDGRRLGDAAASEVVDEYIKYLASGIASMINIFQPEVLSIGGGISNEGQYLLDLVTPRVREQQYGTGLVPMPRYPHCKAPQRCRDHRCGPVLGMK